MELKPMFPSSQMPNLALVSRNSLQVDVFASICEKVSIKVNERSIPSFNPAGQWLLRTGLPCQTGRRWFRGLGHIAI